MFEPFDERSNPRNHSSDHEIFLGVISCDFVDRPLVGVENGPLKLGSLAPKPIPPNPQ